MSNYDNDVDPYKVPQGRDMDRLTALTFRAGLCFFIKITLLFRAIFARILLFSTDLCKPTACLSILLFTIFNFMNFTNFQLKITMANALKSYSFDNNCFKKIKIV